MPELVELVMARPLVSAAMVAKTLDVTPQAARHTILELGLREMTGMGDHLRQMLPPVIGWRDFEPGDAYCEQA